MGKTVERIDQELTELDHAIAQLGDEFYSTYQTYVQVFGHALRQQFILAAHHICTQVYPQAFLQLSLSQRQTLQQELLRLVKAIQSDLTTHLLHPNQPIDLMAHAEGLMSLRDHEIHDFENAAFPKQAMLDHTAGDLSLTSVSQEHESGIYRLGRWLEQQERRIVERLRQLSWEANQVLQQAQVLPPKLPEPLLEMTVKGELLSGTSGGVPNILDIRLDALKDHLEEPEHEPSELGPGRGDETEPSLAEGEEDSPSQKSDIGKILSIEDFLPLLKKLPVRFVAIQLNITDIEFTDAIAASQRSRIRQLMSRFNKIESVYRKKLQAKTVISAEDAWRSSWFESSS